MFGNERKLNGSAANEAFSGLDESIAMRQDGVTAGKVTRSNGGFEISEEALRLPPSKDEMSMEG